MYLSIFFQGPRTTGRENGSHGDREDADEEEGGGCGRDGSGKVLPCNHVSFPISVVMSRLSA